MALHTRDANAASTCCVCFLLLLPLLLLLKVLDAVCKAFARLVVSSNRGAASTGACGPAQAARMYERAN